MDLYIGRSPKYPQKSPAHIHRVTNRAMCTKWNQTYGEKSFEYPQKSPTYAYAVSQTGPCAQESLVHREKAKYREKSFDYPQKSPTYTARKASWNNMCVEPCGVEPGKRALSIRKRALHMYINRLTSRVMCTKWAYISEKKSFEHPQKSPTYIYTVSQTGPCAQNRLVYREKSLNYPQQSITYVYTVSRTGPCAQKRHAYREKSPNCTQQSIAYEYTVSQTGPCAQWCCSVATSACGYEWVKSHIWMSRVT